MANGSCGRFGEKGPVHSSSPSCTQGGVCGSGIQRVENSPFQDSYYSKEMSLRR